MKKQKICVIGDGLSGLTAALVLSNLDINVDFITKNKQEKKINDPRITAISPTNFKFLNKYLDKKDNKLFWPCKKINLFYEKINQLYNFINFSEDQKNLLYIIKNNDLKKVLLKKIKRKKNIKIISNEVKKVDTKNSCILFGKKSYAYHLILLCVGRSSKIISELVGKRFIQKDDKEIALTSMVNHNINISDPRQYFLKEGPLAILPINEKNFSFVWSVSNKLKNKNINDLVYNKLKKILGKKTSININKIITYPISFKFNSIFSKNNSLVLGDGSYNVHPVAGQGFNLIIRDIMKLFQFIEYNQSLGLPIKDSEIIKKFVSSRKPENLLFGLGINLTNSFFKQNKITSPIKDFILSDINKLNFLKEMSIKISDKGIFQSLK